MTSPKRRVMKIKKLINFLWILPFSSFLLGYCVIYIVTQKQQIYSPNVIGKNIQNCITIASEKGLAIKQLRQQEDPDLPEGTILDQIPKPQSAMRANQYLLLTVSKKPKGVLAPNFFGQNQKTITSASSKQGINSKIFWLKSIYPINTCFAQYPEAEQELDKSRKVITYFSSGNQTLYIVPDLRDLPFSEVKTSLEKENIKLEVFYSKKENELERTDEIKIIDQKPMPGSIVDLNKTLFMQLQV